MKRLRTRLVVLAAAASAALAMAAAPATANAADSALDLANAIVATPALIVGAEFTTLADPSAALVTQTSVLGFATDGDGYAVLANTDAAEFIPGATLTGFADSGAGPIIYDQTTLRLDLMVPAGVNCLTVNVAFASAEYPTYVGSAYNDAFLVELDQSDWSVGTGNAVVAPHNFAFDAAGNALTVNAAGASSMSTANAADLRAPFSNYGASPMVQAATPVTPGAHSVYFTIFNMGDHSFSSAGFIDNLRVGTAQPGQCVAGVGDLQPAVAVVYVDDDAAGAAVTPTAATPTSLIGDAGSPVGFSADMAEAGIPAGSGYELAGIDNVAVFPVAGTATITVHLKHHQTVTTLTTTRTIHYSGAGTATPDDVTQTQTWTKSVDAVTGAIAYAAATGYPGLASPALAGLAADPATVAATAAVAATATAPVDSTVNVVYGVPTSPTVRPAVNAPTGGTVLATTPTGPVGLGWLGLACGALGVGLTLMWRRPTRTGVGR